MAANCLQNTFFFILLTLLIGQGDGQWKKTPRDVLQRDIKIYKKMTEKLKQEFEDYYTEYSNEPINDYFLEEIDYVQSKIEKHVKQKINEESNKEISFNNVNFSQKHPRLRGPHTTEDVTDITKNVDKNLIKESIANVTWPKFEEILLAIGKQYDWKNDRWLKVKAKMKDKQINRLNTLENIADHQKHNFKYRIVKLNRTKSKRKVVIAVTAVR